MLLIADLTVRNMWQAHVFHFLYTSSWVPNEFFFLVHDIVFNRKNMVNLGPQNQKGRAALYCNNRESVWCSS